MVYHVVAYKHSPFPDEIGLIRIFEYKYFITKHNVLSTSILCLTRLIRIVVKF